LKTERPIPIWTESFPGIFRVWLGTANLDEEDEKELEECILDALKEVTDISERYSGDSPKKGQMYERLGNRFYFFRDMLNPDATIPNVRYGNPFAFVDLEPADRWRVSVLYQGLGAGTKRKQVLDTVIGMVKEKTRVRFGLEPVRLAHLSSEESI
jgi:hypothetical protein